MGVDRAKAFCEGISKLPSQVQSITLDLLYYIDSLHGSVVPALSGKGQAYLSCARKPGFLFFSEKDQTTLLACLLDLIQQRTSLLKFVGGGF